MKSNPRHRCFSRAFPSRPAAERTRATGTYAEERLAEADVQRSDWLDEQIVKGEPCPEVDPDERPCGAPRLRPAREEHTR